MKKIYNIINTFFVMLCVTYNISFDNKTENNNIISSSQINPLYIEIKNVMLEKNSVNRLYFTLPNIMDCYKLDIHDTKIDFIQDYRRNDCFTNLISYNSSVSSVFRVNNKIYDVVFTELFLYKNEIILTFKTNNNIEDILEHNQRYSIIWDMPYILLKKEYYTIIDKYDPFMDNFNSLFAFIEEYKQLFYTMFE